MKPLAINHGENVLLVHVNQTLSKEMISTLQGEIDSFINTKDRVPNLVISCETAPHWDSFATLIDHMKVVQKHHNLIRKVAIVDDAAVFSVVPALLDHFVGAKLRHFHKADFEKAVEWANNMDAEPSAFHILDGFPHDVIAVQITGEVSGKDYDEFLVPLVEEKLKEHDKIKFFCKLGDDFDSYSLNAAWDDMRLGLKHPLSFSKCALVTNVNWLRRGAKVLGPMMPMDLMVFRLDEEDTARAWIKT